LPDNPTVILSEAKDLEAASCSEPYIPKSSEVSFPPRRYRELPFSKRLSLLADFSRFTKKF
jgi:hypothetical protein